MFIDAITKRCSRLGEKPHRLVIETREKIYYRTYRDEETGKLNTVEMSRGSEIVKEILVSDEGLRIWQETQGKSEVVQDKPALKHRVIVSNRTEN